MSRVLIAGGPRTGKTTFADALAQEYLIPPRSTDELVGTDVGWSDASARVALWFGETPNFLIEGVVVPRALRKWLANNPTGTPCDVLWWLSEPHVALSPGQLTLSKGVATVFAQVEPELLKRGVDVRRVRAVRRLVASGA